MIRDLVFSRYQEAVRSDEQAKHPIRREGSRCARRSCERREVAEEVEPKIPGTADLSRGDKRRSAREVDEPDGRAGKTENKGPPICLLLGAVGLLNEFFE